MRQLLAFISDDFTDEDVDVLGEAIQALGASRAWLKDPPAFVDDADDEDLGPEDEPIRTVGARLALAAVGASQSDASTSQADSLAFIEAIRRYSEESGLQFEFELDDESVGAIQGGKVDRVLQEELLKSEAAPAK